MVKEAQQAGWNVEAVVLRDDITGNVFDKGVVSEERFFSLDTRAFQKLSALESPEGVLAIIHMPATQSWGTSLPKGSGFLLERIQDPGNLGTLMRIADWFGLSGIYCSTGTVDVFNPKTLRASMGAIFRVKVHYAKDWRAILENNASRIWLADMDGVRAEPGVMSAQDWVLLGNEANGVSESSRVLFPERRLTIPGGGGAESLNVAVAGGILGYLMN